MVHGERIAYIITARTFTLAYKEALATIGANNVDFTLECVNKISIKEIHERIIHFMVGKNIKLAVQAN